MNLTDKAVDSGPPTQPKPYVTPRLVCYGSVKDLVQGGGSGKKDGGTVFTKSCWVAEALYGIHDPRTTLVRAWLSEAAAQSHGWRCFAALYRRCGRTAAALIYRGYLPRQLFRPIFDGLVNRAFHESAVAIKAAGR